MPASVYDIRERSSAFSKPTGKKRPDINVQRILDEVTDAQAERDAMTPEMRALFNLAVPNRQSLDGQQPGQPRQPQEKYASEPQRSYRRGVGNLTNTMVPADQEWGEYQPGPDVPENQRTAAGKITEEMTKQAFAALRQSRFASHAHTMGYDLLASMGFMHFDIGSVSSPLKVQTIPWQESYPVAASDGSVRTVHRKYETRVEFLEEDYRGIQLTPRLQALKARNPRTKVECIYATPYEAETGMYRPCVLDPESKKVMYEAEPRPISTWLAPRLSVCPGNVYGTGFGIEALPAIRVLNKMRESTLLAGARMGRPPLLMATETGLNPHTIRLSPNAVGFIKLSALNGNPPFYQLPTGDPSWNELSAEQLIGLIDDILLGTPIVGPSDDLKGVTAFAISVRRAQVLLERGVDLARLIDEYSMAALRIVGWILSRLGKFPNVREPIMVDDQFLSVVPKGPLALAQQLEKANGVMSTIASLRATLGDQVVTLGIKVEDVPARIAEMTPGFPDSLIRDEEERTQMQQQAAAITAAEMTQQAPSAAPIDLQQPLA